MERTLKEQEALKQAQNIAEGLSDNEARRILGNDMAVVAQLGTVWGLIAVHEALHRLTDVMNDLAIELEFERTKTDE